MIQGYRDTEHMDMGIQRYGILYKEYRYTVHGYMYRVQGCVHGYKNTGIQGYINTAIQGSMDIGIQVIQVTQEYNLQ